MMTLLKGLDSSSVGYSIRGYFNQCFLPVVHAQEVLGASTNIPSHEACKAVIDDVNILVTDAEVQAIIDKETGMQRLLHVWEYGSDRFGIHPNLLYPQLISTVNGVFTAFLLAIMNYKSFRDQYISECKHVKWKSKYMAVRRVNDYALSKTCMLGIRIGLRFFLFSYSTFILYSVLTTYRNKDSPMHAAVGAGVSGSLAKVNLGLRGMFAGGMIGSVLGLIGGAGMCLLLKSFEFGQVNRHFTEVKEELRKEMQYKAMGK